MQRRVYTCVFFNKSLQMQDFIPGFTRHECFLLVQQAKDSTICVKTGTRDTKFAFSRRYCPSGDR